MRNQKGFAQFIIILAGSLVILLSIVFFAFKNGQIRLESSPNNPIITPTIIINEWKTYTNSMYHLIFKYPQEYKFEEQFFDETVIAWMGNISNPKNVVDRNTKAWDILNISVAVRRKMGQTFEQWIKNECSFSPKFNDLQDIKVDNRSAKRFICPFGETSQSERFEWLIIAIDNGDYVYTLTNTGYKRDQELDKVFDQILSTFKFTDGNQSNDKVEPEVYEAFKSKQRVSVIVGLKTPSELTNTNDLDTLKKEIDNIQEKVLLDLDLSEFSIIYKYDIVSALALEINETALIKLETNPYVEGVGLSVKFTPKNEFESSE